MIGNSLGHRHANFWTWELIWSKVRGVGVAPTHPTTSVLSGSPPSPGLKCFDKRTKITAPVCLEKVLKLNNYRYKLLSLIHHHGTTKNSGHYTASAVYSNMFHCDDDRVTIHEHNTLSASTTAYVALYRKC